VEQGAGRARGCGLGAGHHLLSGDVAIRRATACRRGGGDVGRGELYLTSGAKARKARNLAANPACTISVKLEGIDLVLEGEAIRATDKGTLERLAGRYRAVGWPQPRWTGTR
jgi:hypothetical protein